MKQRWDIFCAVIDNLGDIGVAWRLARQLATEHDKAVRLWVDDLNALSRICPHADANATTQTISGVEVYRWCVPFPEAAPADVVIETFGCHPPESYVIAMAHLPRQPVWINLDYLSAESWIDTHHGLPSPHPRLPLTKYFYFPGFTPHTGGLLREQGLFARRDAFGRDPAAQEKFWQSLQLQPPAHGELRVSLFCYDNPALPGLFAAWASGSQPITCLVPDGVATGALENFFAAKAIKPRQIFIKGALQVCVVPFSEQTEYDKLLWACDINFVRGEDSFLRAQWAAKPFVWHIYPQKENAHWVKLNAFIDLYCADLPACEADSLRDFWRAWNAGRGAGEAWPGFSHHRLPIEGATRRWADNLAVRPDLARGLADFCQKLIK